MNSYFTLKKAPFYIKFIITIALFVYVKDFSSINSFSKLVIALLEFIIILELVRMLMEFLFGDENRLKLRLMIDSTIIFFIRDIMLIVNDKFDLFKIIAVLGIIAVLLVFRIVTMKFSPSYFEHEYKKNFDNN